MEYRAIRSPDRCPAHPGELLREVVIPATGPTVISRLLAVILPPNLDIVRWLPDLNAVMGDEPGIVVCGRLDHRREFVPHSFGPSPSLVLTI